MSENQTKSLTISYVMVKIGDREKLVPAIEKLYLNDQVVYCDAIDGDYNLMLIVQGASVAEIDQFVRNHVKGLGGVQAVESCRIENPSDELLRKASLESEEGGVPERYNGEKAQSYLMVEADATRLKELASALESLDSVAACDLTSGRYSMVILLKAAGFDLIRKVIAEKIRPLPGILRLKQSRIIKMFEM